MSEADRLTLPVRVRRRLGPVGDAQVEVGVEGEAIILRRAMVLRSEGAWAYTPEHHAVLLRSHPDLKVRGAPVTR